jgi:hypothetical protein
MIAPYKRTYVEPLRNLPMVSTKNLPILNGSTILNTSRKVHRSKSPYPYTPNPYHINHAKPYDQRRYPLHPLVITQLTMPKIQIRPSAPIPRTEKPNDTPQSARRPRVKPNITPSSPVRIDQRSIKPEPDDVHQAFNTVQPRSTKVRAVKHLNIVSNLTHYSTKSLDRVSRFPNQSNLSPRTTILQLHIDARNQFDQTTLIPLALPISPLPFQDSANITGHSSPRAKYGLISPTNTAGSQRLKIV